MPSPTPLSIRLYLAPLILVITASAQTASSDETAAGSLRADAPYTAERSNPVNHSVDFAVVVTPPYHCHVLRVWIPVAQSDAAQEVSESQFSTFPMDVEPEIGTEPIYGNKFAYFEFQNPQGAQIIRHRFHAQVHNLHWNVDSTKVERVNNWPPSFHQYLKPQTLESPQQLTSVLEQLAPQQAPGQDFANIFQWVEANLTYDHVNASLKADANHALDQRRGHCSDYHGLCATMGRALGYPTRVTYGLALYPKNSPSHCKMEAFLPPYGWVSFDVSETQKMIQKIQKNGELSADEVASLSQAAQRRLLSGFRENSWLLLTRGTDYELTPKASAPVRVVRTAYVEADGVALPDPDPANIEKREFAWMTAHKYESDKAFKKPFADLSTLDR